ncbi:alpha-amylase family glycosyl hydrolase [Spirochaeta cellobiosiphila]|uniref:alpha-amylase family glycosyl hydrolase n=1 Tax=Spirochaeta cellobiosiphila TaxID=504483 RepID=UPI00041F140A|nr:alpha-amylase family glycosyl hydrolase [Spirochaeta cellobiosiphila]
MAINWNSKTFYHLYPLGFCSSLNRNAYSELEAKPLKKVESWLSHLENIGIEALYLGPVFHSTYHGYDTIDWYTIDPRLGSNEEFRELCQHIKAKGINIILDGVFNHVGKEFWAFKDLISNGKESQYVDWFAGIDFNKTGPDGEPFAYEGWEGHHSLVKLNLNNQDLRNHIFGAVKQWIELFDIDGIRFDVAYSLDRAFLKDLKSFIRVMREDFYFLYEVIHGDYGQYIDQSNYESVTNYECFKGIYSSHNDRNLFEIAHSLGRQFGSEGIYKGKTLYNFVDNHDVNRIASLVKKPQWIHTSYIILFTMPGVPSLYYGSEWGIPGKRTDTSDIALRPTKEEIEKQFRDEHILNTVKRLITIRKHHPALQIGTYKSIHIESTVLAFTRVTKEERILVLINIDDNVKTINLPVKGSNYFIDLLNTGDSFHSDGYNVSVTLYPTWGRILKY